MKTLVGSFRSRALLFVALFAAGGVTGGFAAISFEAAASAGGTNVTQLAWSHTTTSAMSRILVVSVAARDSATGDLAITSVTYNNQKLTAVPGSLASVGTNPITRTQLFYLLHAGLPSANGTFPMRVSFAGTVSSAIAGSTSLANAAQMVPAPVATSIHTGNNNVLTDVNVTQPDSWLIDVVASGASSQAFAPHALQSERYDRFVAGLSSAGSTKLITAAGNVFTSWSTSAVAPMAHSVVAITPAGPAHSSYRVAIPAETSFCPGSTGVAETVNAGYRGTGYFNLANQTGSVLRLARTTVNAGPPVAGQSMQVSVRYANGTATARPMSLYLNEVLIASGIPFNPTGSWTTWGETVVTAPRNHDITFRLVAETADGGPNIDEVAVHYLIDCSGQIGCEGNFRIHDCASRMPLVYEAENVRQPTPCDFIESPTGTGYVRLSSSCSVGLNNVGGNGGGLKRLSIRYALGAAASVPASLSINGVAHQITFPRTGSWTRWLYVDVDVSLRNDNTNTIQLATFGTAVVYIDSFLIPGGNPPAPIPDTYQAEAAPITGTGTVYESTHTGFRGTGYVNLGATDGTLTFNNVDGNGGGRKSLSIRYALGAPAARTANIIVNSGAPTPITFTPTGAWTTWQTFNVSVDLTNPTPNTIQFITTGNDCGNIDEITVP